MVMAFSPAFFQETFQCFQLLGPLTFTDWHIGPAHLSERFSLPEHPGLLLQASVCQGGVVIFLSHAPLGDSFRCYGLKWNVCLSSGDWQVELKTCTNAMIEFVCLTRSLLQLEVRMVKQRGRWGQGGSIWALKCGSEEEMRGGHIHASCQEWPWRSSAPSLCLLNLQLLQRSAIYTSLFHVI